MGQRFNRLQPVLLLIGFTATVAQILLMRELLVVFYGNEISLGLLLASWLLWTGAGSGLFGRKGSVVSMIRVKPWPGCRRCWR